jgi:uncharacterized protein (TIGR03435 family)
MVLTQITSYNKVLSRLEKVCDETALIARSVDWRASGPDSRRYLAGDPNPPNQNDGIRLAFKIEDLFLAFQEQLGLKLNTTKAPADMLVIDNVSKPSEN